MPFKFPRDPDAIPTQARIIKIGDICYVKGGSTKVRVIGKPETFQPECVVLEINTKNPARFKVGQKHRFPRTLLYPRKGKTGVKK